MICLRSRANLIVSSASRICLLDVSAKTLIYSTGIENTETVEGQGGTMRLIITEPLTSARSVSIAQATKDLSANVNTGDENFCAS